MSLSAEVLNLSLSKGDNVFTYCKSIPEAGETYKLYFEIHRFDAETIYNLDNQYRDFAENFETHSVYQTQSA